MGVLDDYYYNTQNDYTGSESAMDYYQPESSYYQPYEVYEPQQYTWNTPPEQSYITPGESYTEQPSALTSFMDTLNAAGKFMQSPGGSMLSGLLGGGISAYGAMQQNAMQKKAQKEYQKQLAARQAKAELYSSPLRLTMERQQVAGPVTGKGGEALFFTNNQLPKFYAEGGAVEEPGVLGFIKYLLAGKKLPYDLQQEKEARNRPVGIKEALEEYAQPESRLERQMKEQGLACGGSPNYVQGGDAGQADTVSAQVSPGEYWFDADVVSALGDGNNEAGAARLDEMRENIRAHKRSAPSSEIPPKAKSPLMYLKEKKNGR